MCRVRHAAHFKVVNSLLRESSTHLDPQLPMPIRQAPQSMLHMSAVSCSSPFLALGFEVVFGICNSPLPFECECTVRVCVCVFILVIWLIAEICKFGERIRVGHEERKPVQGNQCTCA